MADVDLCSLSYVREHQQITDTGDTSQDDLIEALITSASKRIMAYTQRQFSPAVTAATYKFRYNGRGVLNLAPYDLRSVTTIQIDTDTTEPTTLTSTEYRLAPIPVQNGVYSYVYLKGYPVFRLTDGSSPDYREVSITGNWGYSAVPDDVARACAITVVYMLRTQSQFITDEYQGSNGLNTNMPIPGAAMSLLESYKRHTAGM